MSIHIRPDSFVASAMAAWADGWTDRKNAEWHGVTMDTIRRWRREYVRKGLPRGQQHTTVPCPRCDGAPLDEAAYAELLGWYLGDGYISTQRRGVFGLHIYNDAKYVDLNAHLIQLMRRVKPQGKPHTRQQPGCIVTTTSWQHWPCLFPQHGRGRKNERVLGMEAWQREIVERCPADFLRGLFHSDGCRAKNWAQRTVNGVAKRYDYPRWHFTNESAEIMGWCRDALDLVDVPWRQSRPNMLSVSRREAVARLDGLIGLKS